MALRKEGPTPEKAGKMLREGSAHGRPLTPAAKRFFHAIVGEASKMRKRKTKGK